MNASARSPAAAPTRREILVGSLAFGSLLLAPRLLRADPRPSAPSGRRAIVLLHLRGGNDGLNTVVPLRDEHYRRLRPALALDPAVLPPPDRRPSDSTPRSETWRRSGRTSAWPS